MVTALQTAVSCPWCARYFSQRPEHGHCDNCGGALAAPTGAERGLAPPDAPRVLPAAYRRSVMFSRNVFSILGVVFLAVGTPFLLVAVVLLLAGGDHVLALILGLMGLIFPGIGAPMLMVGLRRGRRQIAALELGTPAEGELVSVAQNRSETINGRHPWVIEYQFTANGAAVRGTVQCWSLVDGERRPGDPVWVVYLVADPQMSTLWPPVR